MENEMEKRKLTLKELSTFIDSSQYALDDTIRTLGWDESKLSKAHYKTCPINPEHRIPETSLDKHINACSLRHEGYSADVNFLPESFEVSESFIVLDEKTRSAVIHSALQKTPGMRTSCGAECVSHQVPRTSDRVFASSTPDERLALYDYVVEKTKHRHSHDLPLNLPFPNNSDGKGSEPKSVLEVRAQERDAKRRSVSYKSVHTSRKSHTEILREVIENQMELLQSSGKHKK